MAREMKDSGIEWIGEIPKKWLVKKIKHGFTIFAGATPKSEKSEYWNGEISWITPADYKTEDKYVYTGRKNISMEGYKSCGTTIVPKGSVIFSKRAPVGTVAISGNELCTNQGCLACVPLSMADSIYYYYAISAFTEQFELVSSGTTFKEISANAFANFSLPFPIYEEQIKISSYLDKKCVELDNVLDKTRASIEEYKKLKQAVITQAVTKGVRGNREMKDSGIEWIGEIPVDWNLIKITQLLDYNHPYPIGDGDHGMIKTDDYIDTGIPYIRVQNLGWGTELNYDNMVYISEDRNQMIANSILKPNDILFAKTGATIGKTAIIPDSMSASNTTSHIGKITVSPNYNPKYIFYVMSSYLVYRQFWEMAGLKSTRPELSIDEIKKVRLIVPSRTEEQEEIARYLDEKCSAIDEPIAKKEQYLSEIENYKKSLIYEYVTGKKEVPQE